MGLFQQRLAERRRQQHGAAALDIADLGTPDLEGLDLVVRTSTPREQGLNLRQTRVSQRTPAEPKPKPKRIPKPRLCCDCNADITALANSALRCLKCREAHKLTYSKEDWAKRAAKAGKPTPDRSNLICVVCGKKVPLNSRRIEYCSDLCRNRQRETRRDKKGNTNG